MITGTRNSPIGTWHFFVKADRYEVIDNRGCSMMVLYRTLYIMVTNKKYRLP
jgi:hypothetical protein